MKKTFDSVSWMRQRRVQIDNEDANLTWMQKREKTRDQVLQDPILAQLSEETIVPDRTAPRK
jgi:hypothetical protein